MKLKNGTQVIVADSEHVLLLENRGDQAMLDLRVVDHSERENPPTHELGTDRPGRLRSPNDQRSAVATTDWHDLAKTNAARDIAGVIESPSEDAPDILLIADPVTMGRVRPQLSREAQARMCGEITKDLSNHTVEAIEAIIAAQAD